MKIAPINVMPVKALNRTLTFTQRKRVGQDNEIKFFSPSKDVLLPSEDILRQGGINYGAGFFETIDTQNQTYDSFTGLRDKNYLFYVLDKAIHNSQIDNKPLSIAMFDMDDFKSINEFLGYSTGDIFIKETSRTISKIARESDVDVYRFGGEEFVMVFNGQHEREKRDIAQSIVKAINEDESIQQYKTQYMQNARSRLYKSTGSTLKVQNIAALKTEKETIEKVRKHLSSEQAKNDPYFQSTIKRLEEEINNAYIDLIFECIPKEQDEKSAKMLLDLRPKLLIDKQLSKQEQTVLDDYLHSVYNKANEIYQTKKWISDFEQNGGFGVTCGIVDFEPEALEFKKPMEIIDKAGLVLKKGKNRKKGQVYCESIRF